MKLKDLLTRKPKGTDELVHINDIIIPKAFEQSTPAQWKMDRALEYYKKHRKVDKPLLVEPITNEIGKPNQLLLVDNYTRFLVLLRHDITRVPVKYVKPDGQ